MLPTFPKIENFRDRSNLQLVQKLAADLTGILNQIGKHVQFEGSESAIIRLDGTVAKTPMHAATGETRFSRPPLAEFTYDVLRKQLENVAKQLARNMSEHLFGRISEVTAEIGNVVDAKGQPLSEDLILKILDKMEHEFEPDGTWKPPTLVASPQAIDRLMKLGNADGTGSAEFNESLRKLLEKKRDDFRRREADRVLAG